MQITIIQSEIELAITRYIKSIITINDGSQIDIDLRATRGVEGFQAIIDIRTAGDDNDGGEEVSPPSTPAPKPDPAPAATPVEETSNGPVDPLPESTTTPATRTKRSLKFEAVDATPVEAEVDTEAAADEPKEAARSLFGAPKTNAAGEPVTPESDVQAPTNSIFGNLKRPVNA